MNESVLIPEMVTAGMEALLEAERNDLDTYQTVMVVWLAMEAVKAIAQMKEPQEMVH